jgi:site-specific DNA recombinase
MILGPRDNPARRVALYARVSSEDQATAGTIENQVQFFERWSELNALTVAGTYLDDGVRGVIPWTERPGTLHLLADVRAGLVDEVVVYRVDRIGRDLRVIMDAIAALEERGVKLRSMTEPFDTSTPSGSLIISILAAFAGFERQSILARAQEGQKRKARAGGWLGGSRCAYGYKVVGKRHEARLALDTSPVPEFGADATRQSVVRHLFQQVAHGGKSAVQLAADLTALGVPAYRGGTWAPAVVARMIGNPVYKGEHHYGDEIGGGGALANLTAPAPAIVEPELWQAANDALQQNRRLSSKGARRDYLLRGLVFCGHCGSAYTGLTMAGYDAIANETGNAKGVVYRCNAKTYKGRTCTESKSVPGSLETTVWEACRYWLQRPEEVAAMLEAHAVASTDQSGDAALLERIEQQLIAKQTERLTVARAHRKGTYDDATAETMLGEIRDEENLLKAERHRLTQQETVAADMVRYGQESIRALKALAARLATDGAPSWADKRMVIECLVERIIVTTRVNEKGKKEPDVVVRFRFEPGSNYSRNTQGEGQINYIQSLL